MKSNRRNTVVKVTKTDFKIREDFFFFLKIWGV